MRVRSYDAKEIKQIEDMELLLRLGSAGWAAVENLDLQEAVRQSGGKFFVGAENRGTAATFGRTAVELSQTRGLYLKSPLAAPEEPIL
jgi:hypothetical protein